MNVRSGAANTRTVSGASNRSPQRESPRVISVANQKGGCGKTTTVVSLASAFAQLGKTVLIVDMDFQGNASSGLGLKRAAQKEGRTLTDAVRKGLTLRDVRVKTGNPNIDLIVADIELNRVAVEITGRPKQARVLKDLLDCEEVKEYDVILVDTHPSLDCMLQSALAASHHLLIPLFAEPDGLEGLVFLLEEFREIQKSYNAGLNLLGLAVTRYDGKNQTHVKFANLLRAWCEKNNTRLFDSIVPASTAVAGARTLERSVVDHKSTLPVSQAYLALAEEMATQLQVRAGRRAEPPRLTPSTVDAFGDLLIQDGLVDDLESGEPCL